MLDVFDGKSILTFLDGSFMKIKDSCRLAFGSRYSRMVSYKCFNLDSNVFNLVFGLDLEEMSLLRPF